MVYSNFNCSFLLDMGQYRFNIFPPFGQLQMQFMKFLMSLLIRSPSISLIIDFSCSSFSSEHLSNSLMHIQRFLSSDRSASLRFNASCLSLPRDSSSRAYSFYNSLTFRSAGLHSSSFLTAPSNNSLSALMMASYQAFIFFLHD